MQIVELKLGDIKPYENNPRVNRDAIGKLAEIIKNLGFRNPILVNKDHVIIEGHTRWEACKLLGWDTMPCIVEDDLTEEQEKALRIADNKVAEIADWDEEKLKVELDFLKEAGFDLSQLAFQDDELDALLGGESVTPGQTEENAVPDTPEVAVSKPGEIYVLGDHRLLCGDSTKPEDVSRLVGIEECDMWLTDPPYNVAYEGSDGQKIMNDSMEDVKFREFLRSAFGLAEKALKPGAPFYIFHADSEGYNFRGACHDIGLRVRQCLVWKKNALVLGRQDYQWIHEPCLYGWKDGDAHKWFGDRAQTTVMEYNKPKKNDVHPTMKPVEMLVYLLRNSSKRGNVVLDTFGGSGSTLIACEETGRVCRTMELDPKYCDVIRRRWAEFKFGEGCDWQAKTPAEGSEPAAVGEDGAQGETA